MYVMVFDECREELKYPAACSGVIELLNNRYFMDKVSLLAGAFINKRDSRKGSDDMRRLMLLIIAGAGILSGIFANIMKVNAAVKGTDGCYNEEMKLLQTGGFSIFHNHYNFDREDVESISFYLSSGTRNADSLLEKQKAVAIARGNDNETLEDRKRECARMLYNGMTALEKQIDVAEFALTREEFKEVISDVINSNPELFYIRNGYKVNTFPLSDTDPTEIVNYCCGFYEYQDTVTVSETKKEYIPQRDKIRGLIAQVETQKENILSSVLVNGMSSVEKALMIHEYLILNTQYDYAAYLEYKKDPAGSRIPDSDYDIYGTLVNGMAVCQGYALSYKYLLEAAGIENVGFASNTDHVWNTITLSGSSYYVDCTWDDPNWDTLGNVNHQYFLKGQDSFLNHVVENTDRTCQGTAYDDAFWNQVNSGIFYCKEAYYYIGDDGCLYRTRFRTTSGLIADTVKVTDLELSETDSWNYMNGAKMAVTDSYVLYHDSKNIYAYGFRNGDKLTVCTPQLAENELIYGLTYQKGQFRYATRNQRVDEDSVGYQNCEQRIYSYTLPADLFYVPVKEIHINGEPVMHLSMVNGKMYSEKVDLKVSVLPDNATNKRIQEWTSSNPSVAAVDINGRVKGVSPGEAVITAVSYDGVSGSYSVKVIPNGPFVDVDGSISYYDNGRMLSDQFCQIDGRNYYIGKNGKKVNGWQEIKGKIYYQNENGILTDWQMIDGKKYYFDKDGVMLTGWQSLAGYQYYFDINGVMLTGWQTIDGRQYYFNSGGTLASTGWQIIEAKRYYFNKNGIMSTGWRNISGKRYYFDTQGAAQTGWKTIKKKKYYFDKQGVMQTGWKAIKKKKYYFGKQGVMQTGWKTIKKKKYYFGKQGVMQTGWKTIKKKKYYFNKQGVMQTGWKTIRKKRYYFDKKGVMRKGGE